MLQALAIVILMANCRGADPATCRYRTGSLGATFPMFTLGVTLPDGSVQSCSTFYATVDGGFPSHLTGPLTGEISGWVSDADTSGFSLDACAAGSGCSAEVYRFAIGAPELTVALPVGRPVFVRWWIVNGGWSCGQALVVSDGLAADTGSGAAAALWLAGADSLVDPPISLPFSVARQELYCNPSPSLSQGCGGNDVPPDDYAFVFTPLSGEPALTLATDKTGTLPLTTASGAGQHLLVRNLRSYQTTKCDDYANWAWWAAGHAGPSGLLE